MAYSYKTSVTFGLVYIPVTLTAAAKPKDVSFNLLEKSTGKRVRNKRVADGTDREVKQADTVKGYEYEKGRYVVFDESDFEKIKTKNDRTINVEAFVRLSDIDPVYFEKSYYVTPAGGERAFALLCESLEKTKRVGIAKTVLGSKENLVALRMSGGKMLLSTLYFADEITAPPSVSIAASKSANKQERDLAVKLIEAMSAPFDPHAYRNEYNEKVLAAVEDKIAGKQIVSPAEKQDSEKSADSLLDALIASIKGAENHAPV